ncbi:hypothetical protein [Actinoallomurus vinaceus]
MNHAFGRRVATAAAALAATGAAVFAISGTASAAPIKDTHPTTVVSRSTVTVEHGYRAGGRHDDDRSGDRYRGDDRHHGDLGGRRWYGHRHWKHDGIRYFVDHGRLYRLSGHRLYYWRDGAWRFVRHLDGLNIRAYR